MMRKETTTWKFVPETYSNPLIANHNAHESGGSAFAASLSSAAEAKTLFNSTNKRGQKRMTVQENFWDEANTGLQRVNKTNLNNLERSISIISGATILFLGAKRPSWGGLLMAIAGGALVHTGVTGYCAAHAALGRESIDSISDDSNVARDIHVERAITINKDANELYSFWRQFENLPGIMRHLEAVTVLDDLRSHWVAIGPAGKRFEWYAEIYNEIPNEMIAWKSLPGADIVNAGSVHFDSSPGGRGTRVKVVLNYNVPGGKLTALFAKPFRTEPGQLIEDDLRRFKQLMETGEIPRTEGQPTGAGSGAKSTDGKRVNEQSYHVPLKLSGRERGLRSHRRRRSNASSLLVWQIRCKGCGCTRAEAYQPTRRDHKSNYNSDLRI